MNNRLLSIIGAVLLLGLSGCVVADYHTRGHYGGYGYNDPWLYGGHYAYYDPYYYGFPGYFGPYPYYRHGYPASIGRHHRDVRHHDWPGRTDGRNHFGSRHDRNRDHDRDHGKWLSRPPGLHCRGPRC